MAEGRCLRWIYRWRVRTASAAFLLTLALAAPTLPSVLAGAGISLLGLAIRAWASGHLRKEKQLAVSGPYRFTRNPLYLGNFILGVGLCAGSASWWTAGVFGVYFIVFYPAIIHTERERMKNLFPGEYEEYRRFVPLFFPFRKPWRRNPDQPFRWEYYLKNKEYRALAGTAVYWLFLAAKIAFKLPHLP